MGLVKEPKGIDFIIKSEPLSKKEEKKLSEFIAKRKQEIAEMKKHKRSKTAKNDRINDVKPKNKSKQKT